MNDKPFRIKYRHIDGVRHHVCITTTRASAIRLFRKLDGSKRDRILSIR